MWVIKLIQGLFIDSFDFIRHTALTQDYLTHRGGLVNYSRGQNHQKQWDDSSMNSHCISIRHTWSIMWYLFPIQMCLYILLQCWKSKNIWTIMDFSAKVVLYFSVHLVDYTIWLTTCWCMCTDNISGKFSFSYVRAGRTITAVTGIIWNTVLKKRLVLTIHESKRNHMDVCNSNCTEIGYYLFTYSVYYSADHLSPANFFTRKPRLP